MGADEDTGAAGEGEHAVVGRGRTGRRGEERRGCNGAVKARCARGGAGGRAGGEGGEGGGRGGGCRRRHAGARCCTRLVLVRVPRRDGRGSSRVQLRSRARGRRPRERERRGRGAGRGGGEGNSPPGAERDWLDPHHPILVFSGPNPIVSTIGQECLLASASRPPTAPRYQQ